MPRHRSSLLILALWFSLPSCGHKPSKDPPRDDVGALSPVTEPNEIYPALCKEPGGQECECGPNSPMVNQFPVNGLRPNGECSPQGIQLVPKSMTGGTCAGATLDLRGNGLVGIDAKGAVVCKGKELVGATFRVRSFQDEKRTILIKTMSEIKDLDGSGYMRPAYEMVDEQQPERSLCDPSAAKDFLTRLRAPPHPIDVPRSSELRVIAVSSELYDVNGKYVPTSTTFRWQGAGEEWIQLACADDALAKRSRAKFPVDQSVRSRAALMMLTANYCGTPSAPITVRDMKIGWKPPPPNKTDRTILEARWDAQGATCVAEPRILHENYKDYAELPTTAPAVLPGCIFGCRWLLWDWRYGVRRCMQNGGLVKRIKKCMDCEGTECQDLTSYVWVEP